MKNHLVICFIFISQIIFSQTNFDRGFNNGFKNGYCFDNFGCVAPYPPITPIPSIGEFSDNYNQGYNRGFSTGQLQKNSEIKQSNKTNKNPWNTPIKFPDVELYQPDYGFLSSVYAKASQNYQQQQYQNQQNLEKEKRNREVDEYMNKLNSIEERKKSYEKHVACRSNYFSNKNFPSKIKDGWNKVTMLRSIYFDPEMEDLYEPIQIWANVKDNKVISISKSPQNWENSESTSLYNPDENSTKKFMIENNINYTKVIFQSNTITNGVANIEQVLYVKLNGVITSNKDRSEEFDFHSLIFFDDIEKYEEAQNHITLNQLKKNSSSKVKTPKAAISKSKRTTKKVKTEYTDDVF